MEPIKHLNNSLFNAKSIKYKTHDGSYFIKEYQKVYFKNGKFVKNKSIENELLLKNMNHNNLVNIKNYVETPAYCYICMKYYPYPDMIVFYENNFNKIIDNIYDNSQTIIKQLIDVIMFLHKNNIAHLDIKLDNILYDKINTKILLCDYEYCLKCNDSGYSCTKILEPMGTKIYLAPEWLLTPIYNNINLYKIDIWNIGIMCYIILSKGNMNSIVKFNNIQLNIINDNLIKSKNINKEFKLLNSLLKHEPSKRLELNQVLQLEFFK